MAVLWGLVGIKKIGTFVQHQGHWNSPRKPLDQIWRIKVASDVEKRCCRQEAHQIWRIKMASDIEKRCYRQEAHLTSDRAPEASDCLES